MWGVTSQKEQGSREIKKSKIGTWSTWRHLEVHWWGRAAFSVSWWRDNPCLPWHWVRKWTPQAWQTVWMAQQAHRLQEACGHFRAALGRQRNLRKSPAMIESSSLSLFCESGSLTCVPAPLSLALRLGQITQLLYASVSSFVKWE
jgi:hypothetical protein